VPEEQRAALAFRERWFGVKSEARVRTLMVNMIERFDRFPEALELLKSLGTVPAALRPWICHLHVQLSDPLYRGFTGELLPRRRDEGYTSIDRQAAARWVETLAPKRWSATTTLKFAANMLSTAVEAGILKGRRDPRTFALTAVPEAVLGYALYLLRTVEFAGSLGDNPYLRSLGVDRTMFPGALARVPGVTFRGLGNVQEVDWRYPTLAAWGSETLGASA
jgi:hypothetical protein